MNIEANGKAKEIFGEFAKLNFPVGAQSEMTATRSEAVMGTAKA